MIEILHHLDPYPFYIYVNVNVYVYSLISNRVHQTSQFTPVELELLSNTVSSPLGRIQHFSEANIIHNSPFFVPQVPVTAGWT